jgi:beta-glucanase (GH16 family)
MNASSSYVCLFALVATCAAGCAPEESSTDDASSRADAIQAPIANGDYTLHTQASGKCLDVSGSSTADGAKVQEWTCNGTHAQVFHVSQVDNGYYEIVNINSNKALDIRDVSTQENAPLQQWGYGGGANQQFAIVDRGGGQFSLHPRHTGMALDVFWGNAADGTTIVQYPYSGRNNQLWTFEGKGGGTNPGGGGNPPPTPSGWKLAWSDEFNGPDGSGVDGSKWKFDTGGSGWGNNELEYYTNSPTNAHQQGGSLVIRATTENANQYGCWYGTCQYTSARLLTAGKVDVAYGRVEARIKIPAGQGIWPAFWMLGENIGNVGWPSCGEIDIMENIGREPGTVHGSMHGPGYSGNTPETAVYNLPGGARFSDDYHVFAVEWEPAVVRFYVDGSLYQTRTPADLPPGTKWVYDHSFFMLLNVAVGGGWPGSPDGSTHLPQEMRVDYVRVYSR